MSKLFRHPSIWLLLALTVWYSGIGGSAVYWYPGYVFVALMLWLVLSGTVADRSARVERRLFRLASSNRAIEISCAVYGIHGLILLATAYWRYYSFSWHVADLGVYSNILDNIVQHQRVFSSYFGVHAFADHFTPTGLLVFAPLYVIQPSAHWMTLAKVACFTITPLLLYQVARELCNDRTRSTLTAVAAGAYWLALYRPAINSLNFEFHPSSLAAPLIVYAFLCSIRNWWGRFWIVMVLMLGLKEHLGVVWIGFGLHWMVVGRHRKLGAVLASAGTLAVLASTLVIVPAFNDGQLSATTEFHLPWSQLPDKAHYLFWLLAPLLFLPVVGWQHGLLAVPAVAVNLIGKPSMYTSQFHYDDLASPLLILASVIAISQECVRRRYQWLRETRLYPLLALLAGLVLLAQLPVSPVRNLRHAWPSGSDREAYRELARFGAEHPESSVLVQNSFGYILHNTDIQSLANCRGPLRQDFVLLIPEHDPAPLRDIRECLRQLSASAELERVEDYKHLVVYRNDRSPP